MSAYGKSANDAYRTVPLVTDYRADVHTSHICYGGEREGRYYSEEFGVYYDVYPCETHSFHIDVDWDREW